MGIRNWTSFFILSLYSTFAFGQSEVKIKLMSLETVHTQEESGDELYLSITEYSKNHLPRNYQIPAFPSHWLSQYATHVKDALVWTKDFKECEDVELLITLVEEDVLPWNADDSLGSVKLKLTCQAGKMQGQWVIPNSETVSKIPNQKDKFSFSGNNGLYNLQFSLENIEIKA
jgi:hypothetical protein